MKTQRVSIDKATEVIRAAMSAAGLDPAGYAVMKRINGSVMAVGLDQDTDARMIAAAARVENLTRAAGSTFTLGYDFGFPHFLFTNAGTL